jgi:hypothetical protein
LRTKNTELLALQAGVFDKQSFNDSCGKLFWKIFDKLYRYAFITYMCSFQNYSQPIICTDNSTNYLALTKLVFDSQWQFLASLCSSDPKKDTDKLTAYKERQVFFQIMVLQGVCNVCDLSYWALIQTTMYYAHGVCATVVNSSQFDGQTLGTSTCNERFASLVKGLTRVRRHALSRHLIVTMSKTT